MRLLDDPDELAFGDEELDLTRSEDRGRLVELVNRQTPWDDTDSYDDEWDYET